MSFSPALKADEIWNLNFTGTDGYSDTLTITGTITTAPGTSPLTIDGVNLTYNQTGFPGAPGVATNDSSTTLSTSLGQDNLLYTTGTYVDGYGLGFLLAGGSGGTDYSGNVDLYYDTDAGYCVPIEDEPSFCGTLTVTPQAPVSATPEPSSLLLFGIGLLATSLLVISGASKTRDFIVVRAASVLNPGQERSASQPNQAA